MPITIEHDSWNESPARLPKESKVKMGDIHGVLPFDGKHDPSSRSSWSQKVFFPYRTAANDWQPKLAKAESVAEAAVAVQALMSPHIYDVGFQPLTVSYRKENGNVGSYTHDLLFTYRNGFRRLVFVRYEASLQRPSTQRAIRAVVAATPGNAADDMIVVNAAAYSRQRRENLFRMYRFYATPDVEADDVVWQTMKTNRSIYLMRDLFPITGIEQHRVFQACYRLIGARKIRANLDNVLWEHSRIELVT